MENKKFKNVVFTGNLLRFTPHKPYKSNQNANITWLANILSPIFEQWFRWKTAVMLWNEDNPAPIPEIFQSYNQPLSAEGFAKIIQSFPNEKIINLFKPLQNHTLIIGFEMPYVFLKTLSLLNIPYIDLMIGPIRFLPDLQIGLRTNNSDWFSCLWEERQPQASIYYFAGALMAKLSRLPPLDLPPNTVLLAGQVPDDVSLIIDGRFAGFEDIFAELEKIFSSNDHIIFKPHPYATDQQIRQQVNSLSKHGRIRIVNTNIYRLMADKHVKKVYALTSSVTKEAFFLKKRGETLLPYPFKITVDGVFDPESYILTFDRILRPSFWSKVFNLPCRPDPDGIQSGMLRESLGRNWGMDLNESQNKTPNVIIDFLFNRLMTLKQKKIIANFFKI